MGIEEGKFQGKLEPSVGLPVNVLGYESTGLLKLKKSLQFGDSILRAAVAPDYNMPTGIPQPLARAILGQGRTAIMVSQTPLFPGNLLRL